MSRRSIDPLDSPSIARRPGPAVDVASAPVEARSAPSPFDQAGFRVRFEWGEVGARALSPLVGLVVVVDVLSFSTSACVAVEQGARVVPARSAESAAAQARSIGATLADPERSVDHPTLSPSSLLALRAKETLVLTSPNGAACALDAAEAGAMVVVGCLRNASAVGRLVATHGGVSVVIAAGERWPDGTLRPALEDLLGAGAILTMVKSADRSPEARAAAAAFNDARLTIDEAIRGCASGLELIGHGFGADVDLAAELDATDRIPVLVDGAFVGGMG
jgi:2-phosphosulfolactate phosphatase